MVCFSFGDIPSYVNVINTNNIFTYAYNVPLISFNFILLTPRAACIINHFPPLIFMLNRVAFIYRCFGRGTFVLLFASKRVFEFD